MYTLLDTTNTSCNVYIHTMHIPLHTYMIVCNQSKFTTFYIHKCLHMHTMRMRTMAHYNPLLHDQLGSPLQVVCAVTMHSEWGRLWTQHLWNWSCDLKPHDFIMVRCSDTYPTLNFRSVGAYNMSVSKPPYMVMKLCWQRYIYSNGAVIGGNLNCPHPITLHRPSVELTGKAPIQSGDRPSVLPPVTSKRSQDSFKNMYMH